MFLHFELGQYRGKVRDDRLLVARLDTVDNDLHQSLHLVAWNYRLDFSLLKSVLIEACFDTSATGEYACLPHLHGLRQVIGYGVSSDVNHADERHFLAAAFCHVFLESVCCVAGTNDKVSLCRS